MQQGDLVTRQSYGGDIIFKVQAMDYEKAILKGVDYRLLADAPLEDLIPIDYGSAMSRSQPAAPEIMESIRRMEAYRERVLGDHPYRPGRFAQDFDKHFFELPGKVLHLDGDPAYLKKCLSLYKELRIPVEGYYVNEANMAEVLQHLLPRSNPDIVVITGHDGILKHRRDDVNSLSSYKNSYNFVNAIKVARQYDRNLDSLTVVAGACQSHFEALVQAGANFASSPARILIHALDPLCIAAKFAYTPVKDTVDVMDVINLTVSGISGIGGVETRGCYRVGLPKMTVAITP